MTKIIKGDCLEEMKKLEDNSVDSIVTDPPYGINFMGKHWDYDIPSVKHFEQMLRVLKPGGHILVACGTRTQHRMAVNIEDAGFEIRDIIAWVYGSGFPKSHAIGKAINKVETKEWANISKALNNIEKGSIIEIWKRNLKNVKIVETQSLKNQIGVGIAIPKRDSVQGNVVGNTNQEKSNLLVSFVEKNLSEVQAISTKINTVLQSVEAEIKQLQSPVKSEEKSSQDQDLNQSMSIFTAQCDVKEWLKENTEVNHKADEALKTLRGNEKYSNEEIINVLYVVIQSVLKHTILNQSKTFQSLDTNQKMGCVSAINVTITKSIMGHLITNTVAILKSKVVDKLQGNEREVIGEKLTGGIKRPPKALKSSDEYDESRTHNYTSGQTIIPVTKGTSKFEGWGTSLKPAMELWTLARKPLEQNTIAENCLKWGTGGMNIDGCRIPLKGEDNPTGSAKRGYKNNDYTDKKIYRDNKQTPDGGRFPANLIHDGSDEVEELMPDSGGGLRKHNSEIKRQGMQSDSPAFNSANSGFDVNKCQGLANFGDQGSAARFFYCAKAHKSERNAGLDNFEDKERIDCGGVHSEKGLIGNNRNPENRKPTKNNHPTIKPIKLLQYLVRLITPKNGVCLDPYIGSGSTAIACIINHIDCIGIEREKDYVDIAEARIQWWDKMVKQFPVLKGEELYDVILNRYKKDTPIQMKNKKPPTLFKEEE